MSIGIYKIENLINHKIYIGQSIEIETRFKKHKQSKDDFAIHRAIRKYGTDNFSYDIIELCSPEKLSEREKYWIAFYNSKVPNGYNMTDGGETVSDSKKVRVRQYSLDGMFLKEYNSATEASKLTGAPQSSIIRVCKKNGKTAGGFQWRYANENLYTIPPVVIKNQQQKIYQLDKNRNILNTFNSLEEAARITSIDKTGICRACKENTQAEGYWWSYQDKYDQAFLTKKKQIKGKSVSQYSTQGKFIQSYISITEASQITGINKGNIGSCVTGARKTAGGYIWKYNDT